ncbi:hypothetical protein J6590_096665 [Homalodisca vitripennis]|nr:hypothetical protein J6590_096665 [Homalodisca vitripennis]
MTGEKQLISWTSSVRGRKLSRTCQKENSSAKLTKHLIKQNFKLELLLTSTPRLGVLTPLYRKGQTPSKARLNVYFPGMAGFNCSDIIKDNDAARRIRFLTCQFLRRSIDPEREAKFNHVSLENHKPMGHLNLGNLMDLQEWEITYRKCRNAGVQLVVFVPEMAQVLASLNIRACYPYPCLLRLERLLQNLPSLFSRGHDLSLVP